MHSRTDKPVKGMLTGPVTSLNRSFPRRTSCYINLFTLFLQSKTKFLTLKPWKWKLSKHGRLREKLPPVVVTMRYRLAPVFSPWYINQHQINKIHTHMCYSEFKRYKTPAIDNPDADVIHLKLVVPNRNYWTLKYKTSKQKLDLGFYIFITTCPTRRNWPSSKQLAKVPRKFR